jgi:hypothetical protein
MEARVRRYWAQSSTTTHLNRVLYLRSLQQRPGRVPAGIDERRRPDQRTRLSYHLCGHRVHAGCGNGAIQENFIERLAAKPAEDTQIMPGRCWPRAQINYRCAVFRNSGRRFPTAASPRQVPDTRSGRDGAGLLRSATRLSARPWANYAA